MCPQSGKRCVMCGYQPWRTIGSYPLVDSEWQHLVAFTILPLKNPSRRAPDRVCAPTRYRDTAGFMNVHLEG